MPDLILDKFRKETAEFLENKGYEDRMKGVVDMWYYKKPEYHNGVLKAEENENCPSEYRINTLSDMKIIPPLVGNRYRKDWGYERN